MTGIRSGTKTDNLACWFTGCLLILTPVSGYSHHAPAHYTLSQAEKQKIIQERLILYRKTFPEIVFTHLAGGKHWSEDYVVAATLLGEAPVNMDYEHPPELASDVMAVSMHRINLMLRQDIVSATLFRSDKNSPLKGQPVCFITLNPEVYAENSPETTAHMVDLADELMAKIHPSRLLDPREHLRFTIDHEVYHCLDSFFTGGAPMTKKKFGGEYNLFRRESGADAYALAMHFRQPEAEPRYAENITLIRALWLFSGGPNRCTFESMLEIYRQPKKYFSTKTVPELVNLATGIRDTKAGSYDFYVAQRVAALGAAKALGYDASIYDGQWNELDLAKARPDQVNYRIKRYKYYYNRLFDDLPVEFLPADPARTD